MSWPEVESMFAGLDGSLQTNATLVIYGPFNYGGAFTSASNADFDQRSDEHTSELQSLMRISYSVFCLKKKKENMKTRRNQPNETQNHRKPVTMKQRERRQP